MFAANKIAGRMNYAIRLSMKVGQREATNIEEIATPRHETTFRMTFEKRRFIICAWRPNAGRQAIPNRIRQRRFGTNCGSCLRRMESYFRSDDSDGDTECRRLTRLTRSQRRRRTAPSPLAPG